MSVPRLRRTIKHAVDLSRMAIISSDELLAMHSDRYQEVRCSATRARLVRQAHFVCGACGEPVYAPRSRTRLPLWKHHPGAPRNCPWWSGTPSAVDAVSARQFDGAQESPLHAKIKNTIGELLVADSRTDAGSVIIDQYLITETDRRRPDVRAIYEAHPLAVEVQLATTQIPIIVQREDFYSREAYRLLWVTWRFEPVSRSKLRTSFEDIFYSHNKNLFSIDEETINLSRERTDFILRAFWEAEDGWAEKLVALSELNWLPCGRAYAVAPALRWHEDFRKRWRAATDHSGTPWALRINLFEELSRHLALEDSTGRALEGSDVASLLNCMFSLLDGQPFGSKQRNLTEVLNTFLAPERRHRYARLLRRFLELTEHGDLMGVSSVQAKLTAALISRQDGQKSETGRVVPALFPEIFAANRGLIDQHG